MQIRTPSIPFIVISLLIAACDDGNHNGSSKADAFTAPPSDCLWVGASAIDNEQLNFAYPDSSVSYWIAVYNLPPDGAQITFEHRFPHSRFMSLTSYLSTGATVDQLTDREIVPANGATNPFAEGNPRNDPHRLFSVTVKSAELPAAPGPTTENILYDGTADTTVPRVLVYRNYVSDDGTDSTGNAGLPRVTLHMADGSIVQGEEACEILNIPFQPSAFLFPEDTYAELRATDPSQNPPVLRAQYTREFQWRCSFDGDCSDTPPRESPLFPNKDNATLYGFLSRKYGEVLVFRGKIPETPKTFEGGNGVFMEGELRYWSICQNEYYSTKGKGCLFDEQVSINDDGFYTIVTSRPEDRPDNATEECGVGFIPWPDDGDGFGIVEGRESHTDDAYLIVRNTLPSADFQQAIQNTQTSGDEVEVLGEFLPKGQYFTKTEFEGLGCNPWLALPYDEMRVGDYR